MTVGQELEKITGLKLMHNHETIELPLRFFGWSSEARVRLTDLFRFTMFEEVAKSDLEGMIFTLLWCFERPEDWEYVDRIRKIFEKEGGEIYMAELEASLEERLKRNKTENRLRNKASKRDVEFSEKDLLESVNKHRLNSNPGEIQAKNYLRIDNTNLSAEDVAQVIKREFDL